MKTRAQAMFDAGRAAAQKAVAASPLYTGGYVHGHNDYVTDAVHRDQYKYAKKSWSYASIRPTATRIAEQQLRIVRGGQVTTERSLKAWERVELPLHVKESPFLNLEPVTSHRLLTAVEYPNPLMVQWGLMWCTAVSLEATGSAHWWFIESEGKLQTWFVPTHWVKPNGVGKWTISINGGGDNPVDVDRNELCHFMIPDPSNPTQPMCSLGAASNAVLTEDAIEQSQERSFQAPMPAYAFVIGERTDADGVKRRPELTKTQREEVNESLTRMFSGPKNRVRALLLDALISDAKRLTPANTEMDYMASGKSVSRKIQQIFGTNPILMGEVENANRASATIAESLHLSVVVNPRLVLIGQTLTAFARQSRLIGDPTILCYYKPVVSRDPDIEQKDWAYARTHMIVSDDDFRANRLGLAPKPNGYGAYARGNWQLQPVDVYGPPVATTAPMSPLAAPPEKDVISVIKAVKGNIWGGVHAEHERAVRIAVADLISRSLDADTGELATGFIESLKSTVRPLLRDAAMAGASIQESVYKSVAKFMRKDLIDIMFGLDGRVPVQLELELDAMLSQPYWDDIGSGVVQELRDILGRYQRDGLSQQEIAERLRGDFPAMAERRAGRIATTETTFAMNAGSYAVSQELDGTGATMGREWNSILDNRTRGNDPDDNANHVIMDGVRVGPREKFNVDGEEARFPGDYTLSARNRVNCRCFETSVSAFE